MEKIVASESIQTDRVNWPVTLFLIGSPVVAVTLLVLYIRYVGFAAVDLIPFFFMYAAGGLSITAGYHRFYAHKTYEAHPIAQFLFLCFGAATAQNSVLDWASDHRFHHQYSDRDGDPYSVKKGFWWAHMGWMFFAYPKNRQYKNAPDLKANKLVMWEHKYYVPLFIIFGFGVPTLIGWFFGRPFAGFVWGGWVRMAAFHQATFMVNSVAHTFGRKTWSKESTAVDNLIISVLAFGEGYHSFHHAHAGDYRIGHRWHHIDSGKWLILTMRGMGLAKGLRKTTALKRPLERVAS